MKTREIKSVTYKIERNASIPNPMAELDTQVATGKYSYLLAHADDGVIWGQVTDKKLTLSTSAFPDVSPVLRPDTLWELRLFGEKSEWHLWRAENKWLTCTVTENEGDAGNAFDEQYILWGTDSEGQPKNGFSLVREADLGIMHTPPVKMNDRHTLKLSVRHYVEHDDAGVAYVKLSRLMNVANGGA